MGREYCSVSSAGRYVDITSQKYPGEGDTRFGSGGEGGGGEDPDSMSALRGVGRRLLLVGPPQRRRCVSRRPINYYCVNVLLLRRGRLAAVCCSAGFLFTNRERRRAATLGPRLSARDKPRSQQHPPPAAHGCWPLLLLPSSDCGCPLFTLFLIAFASSSVVMMLARCLSLRRGGVTTLREKPLPRQTPARSRLHRRRSLPQPQQSRLRQAA